MTGAAGVVSWWTRLLGRGLHPTKRLGARGEREAARVLRSKGYRILRRNLRFSFGEIDLVAKDGETVVFVEVKTRVLSGNGARPAPEASVHARKRRKLAALSDAACRRYGWGERGRRIDIVAVDWPQNGRPIVRHHVGAVRV